MFIYYTDNGTNPKILPITAGSIIPIFAPIDIMSGIMDGSKIIPIMA